MLKPRIFFLLLSFFTAVIAAEEKPCTIHADGKYYDLNPLKTSKDQKLKTAGGHDISLNICQTTRTETYGLKDDIKQEEVAAFIHADHGSFVLGKVNTTLDVFDSIPRLLISKGSKCKSDSGETTNARASSLIKFQCDTSVVGNGVPRLEAQLPSNDDATACVFIFEWKTPHACPAREGGFLWNFFVFVAVSTLCLLMIYTILGTLYNRYVLQLRGIDQIPQFSIESMKYHAAEAWDWLRDMLATMNINLPQRRPGGFGSGGQTNPVSHQSQAGGFRLGGEEEDYESGLAGGGFVRPQHKSRPAPKPSTNPVSHQSQVNAEALRAQASASQASASASPPAPPPKEPAPQSARPERAFTLGDDEEGEELVDVKPTPSTGDSHEVSSGSSSSSASENNTGNNSAAASRGRDIGNDDAIRL